MHKLNGHYKISLKFLTTILLLFVLLSSNLSAQESTNYTLTDVVKIAQDQSPDALIAKHRLRVSYWNYKIFKADYLPNLNLAATVPNLNRTINAVKGQDGTSVYTPESITNYSVDLSLTQKIGFSGGDIFLSSGLRRMDNFLTDTSTTSYLTNMVSIGIRQPIYAYNPYKWLKRIEPMKYEEARRTYVETNEEVASTAINYFFNLLLAQIDLGIGLKNESNYDTLYRIAQGRYTLGKIAENDLLQLIR